MPIRKRLSDPDGADVQEFNRHMKYGRPAPPPRKPTLQERKPFVDALASIPLGVRMPQPKFNKEVLLPLMRRSFEVWGVTLAVYPMATRQTDGSMLCNGVQVTRVERDKLTGHIKTCSLKSEQRVWYGRVISWLAASYHGDPS